VRLTSDEVTRYHSRGCVFPIRVLAPGELAEAQTRLRALLAQSGVPPGPDRRHNPHLYASWVADLVRHPAVLDAVESVLGKNILLWRSTFFVKPARDPSYVAWHQDSVYWDLERDDVATAWIALTDSTLDNGCVQVVEGSHARPALPHTLGFDRHNALLRGQRAKVDVPEGQAVPMELRAGEMSLHHVGLLHGSRANTSGDIRAGLAVRYLAPHVRPRGGRSQASLVRGEDSCDYYDHEPPPRGDDDPEALRWHTRSLSRYADQLVSELLRRPTPRRLASVLRLLARRGSLGPALRYLAKVGWKGSRADNIDR
jgi:non-haem Fe2+, alpha-ketoglutarate-dependent halogenase